jgi:glycyl-tRNA synthetase beta chain
LRRASLGVLRILVEHKLDLDLRELVDLSIEQHDALSVDANTLAESVHHYILDRFSAWFEAEGVSTMVFPAVRQCQERNASDIQSRVSAVEQFLQLPDAQALAAANKRVSNLLSKTGQFSGTFEPSLATEKAETGLAVSLDQVEERVTPLVVSGAYTEALKEMASLREPLDSFFDQVMVMCDDETLRNNRLALLHRVRSLFLQIADISLLAVS